MDLQVSKYPLDQNKDIGQFFLKNVGYVVGGLIVGLEEAGAGGRGRRYFCDISLVWDLCYDPQAYIEDASLEITAESALALRT